MSDPSVSMSPDSSQSSTEQDAPEREPDFYADLARALHAIADDVADLAGTVLPGERIFVTLTINPASSLGEDRQVEVIDAVGNALFGRPGEPKEMSSGGYHHNVNGSRGVVQVASYCSIEPPVVRAQRQEVEDLRAELEALHAERAAALQAAIAVEPPATPEAEQSAPTGEAEQ